MHRRIGLVAALLLLSLIAAACSGGNPGPKHPSATPAGASSTAPSPTPTTSARTTAAPTTTAKKATPSRRHPSTTAQPTASERAPKPTPKATVHAAARTVRTLPVGYSTGSAHQVITVTAPSSSSTTATLQAWRRTSGKWRAVGSSVPAWLGSNGMGHASESSSTTPTGSYTLTQAFGHDANPGTALPYLHTTPADWWISQPGSLYNTRQRCASGCSFAHGDPNEHLYYETPYYNYAVVIDYNTRNAPGGVHPGAGSAFFLHVTVGEPTAGCVSIPEDRLVRLLRWLNPADHPRILLGVR